MGQNSSAAWRFCVKTQDIFGNLVSLIGLHILKITRIALIETDSLPLQVDTNQSFHSYRRDFHSASSSRSCVKTQDIFGNLVSLSGLQLLKITRIALIETDSLTPTTTQYESELS